MLTLNGEQARRNVQMHVCPLQFDIVDRLIGRFSNEGDLVFDPFGGIGTVPLRAMKMGRKGRSAELNTGYFLDAVKYLEAEERKHEMPSLFDLTDDAIESDRRDAPSHAPKESAPQGSQEYRSPSPDPDGAPLSLEAADHA
jgi:hypothetical protein